MMTCTNTFTDPKISCSWGASDEVYKDKVECEKEAIRVYRRPVRCIDIDVEMKGAPKDVEIILK